MRTASRTLTVPPALTSKSATGSTSEVVTATCAARCSTASAARTWGARASAFLTSSFMKVVDPGWRFVNHARLRSVPARDRLSSTVTFQPLRTRWSAALTPRKPAPPVMSTLRVAATSARHEPAHEGDGHDPGCAGEEHRLPALGAALRVAVHARQEEHGEDAVHDVQRPVGGALAEQEKDESEEALHSRKARHD